MSTPRKFADRRVGFTIDRYGRPRGEARHGEWTDAIRREARWGYLQVLSREYPEVLRTLRTLPSSDDAALRAWMNRWGLVSSDPADDWAASHARATVRWCAEYGVTYWFDRDDIKGVAWREDGDLPSVESRPLRHGEHFVWLARFQGGRGWATISPGTPIKTVRDAVMSLAALLRLQLRPTRRGRPKKRQP